MKLKRCLLRYEPPGIGFEVQGEDVRHKDLPDVANVTSVQDIVRIVDELLQEEKEMLSRKKHRPALLKLLGRLYQVQVGAEDDGEEGNESSKKTAKAEELKEGLPVVLIQLPGKLQAHNGDMGIITKVKRDKYEVRMQPKPGQEESDPLKVKSSDHIVPLAPKGTPLQKDTYVVIRALRNHAQLNGSLGKVSECHDDGPSGARRFEVRSLESGQLFRVKQDNLVAVEPLDAHKALGKGSEDSKENGEPNVGAGKKAPGGSPASPWPPAAEGVGDSFFEEGSTVELQGLKSAVAFNGQQAKVISVDRVKGRYEISMADGSVKTVRAENVKLISGPTSRGAAG